MNYATHILTVSYKFVTKLLDFYNFSVHKTVLFIVHIIQTFSSSVHTLNTKNLFIKKKYYTTEHHNSSAETFTVYRKQDLFLTQPLETVHY